MHVTGRKNSGELVSMCFFNWHNDNHIGLAKNDMIATKKRKKDWKMPTEAEVEANSSHIRSLKERFR